MRKKGRGMRRKEKGGEEIRLDESFVLFFFLHM